MAFSYKSTISFGLVYIPVRLHNIIKSNEIGFNLLEKNTNSRISYKKVATSTGQEVANEDIVKGYQYEKDRYVIFNEHDFEKIKTTKDKSINIEAFVDISQIDPIYYNKSYYITPEGAERAYILLRNAMESEGKIGIARAVLGTKENLIAIRIINGEMVLNTMHFHSEVQANPIKQIKLQADEREVELARTIINSMVTEFTPENYTDEYYQRLQSAIQEKIKGQEITVSEEGHIPNIAITLMEALQRTLNQANKQAKSEN